MAMDLVIVNLTRENDKEDWGFDLAGGGKDKDVKLFISQIKPGSIAENVGLKVKDSLVKIGNDCALEYTIEEAMESLKKGKDFFDMIVEREVGDVKLQHEVQSAEDPRYDGLDRKDRNKVGFHDVDKPTLRKDWNCPWIRRDGKGIKSVVRALDPVSGPVRATSNHFYSEPKSILAPEANPEELERMIQERMAMLQGEEDKAKQEQDALRQKDDQRQHQLQQQQQQHQQQQQQGRLEQNKMEVEFSQRHQVQFEEPAEVDEEDSCPPDLEAVELQQQQQQQQLQLQQQQQQYHQQQQQAVEAQRPPVQQEQQPVQNLELNLSGLDSNLVRNLAIAIKASMENYQGSGGTYEPSADELIDVLKNLENLAAQNPALYRAIVDQIKGNPQEQGHEQTNGYQEENRQQGFSEVDQNNIVYEEHYQETGEINGGVTETDHVVVMDPEHHLGQQVDQQQQHQQQQKSAEELKQERIQQEVDLEHAEQMRLLKVKKELERNPPPPPPPKTITVMAGSKNRPAWPIAPGIANANIPRVITLQSAGENQEELMKSRMEVADAAGLKHVGVIHGDEDFYESMTRGGESAWEGSLRPVSNKLMTKGRGGARQDPDMGPSPWAGSLRHVDDKKKKAMMKKKKKEDDDEMYGSAPWMGTLRHVKHENKVTASMPKPQFKRYPDEDAPNPFEGMGGRDAKPVYPLTPAAVVPAGGTSKAGRVDPSFDDVDRITAGLRETRTVSSALLKALMPKLLKEHESKYEPLGHDETFKIMEEILAMQIGLNTEQVSFGAGSSAND
jgi:hypothetical protein